jgi:hypothetical protein
MPDDALRIQALYATEALPRHLVAEDQHGALWLMPDAPLGPEAWAKRRPYRGNYTLTRMPVAIARSYDPRPVGEAAIDEDAIVTVPRAADAAGIPYQTVRRAVLSKAIAPDHWVGNRAMVRVGDVLAWKYRRKGGLTDAAGNEEL